MKTKLLFFILLATLSGTQLQAQKMKEGHIKYGVTNLDISDEMAQRAGGDKENMLNMMKGMMQMMTQDIYFNESMQKMDMNMMGVKTMVYNNLKSGEVYTLMDMMGQKYKIKQKSEAELKPENKPDVQVTYNKDVKKTIAGYECYEAKMIIKNKPEEGKNGGKGGQMRPDVIEMTAYITDKIQPVKTTMNNMGDKLSGYPLEFITNANGLIMTLTASEVSAKVDKSVFDMPTGYKEMTQEEFEKKMGAMRMGQ